MSQHSVKAATYRSTSNTQTISKTQKKRRQFPSLFLFGRAKTQLEFLGLKAHTGGDIDLELAALVDLSAAGRTGKFRCNGVAQVELLVMPLHALGSKSVLNTS